jgi:hypothetical protein
MLPADKRDGSGWKVGPPLVLGAWPHISDDEKAHRLADHIRWAADHGALQIVTEFLLTLREEEWHHRRE